MLITIIAIHLLLLLWLLTRPPTVQTVPDRGHGLMLISLSAGEKAATPPTKPDPPPPIPVPVPPINLPTVLSTPAAGSQLSLGAGAPQAGDSGGGCALAARAAEAITKDPAAMAELTALPPVYRTLADAVMLWNGEWLASTPGSVVAPTTELRRVVGQVVADASPECREQPTDGPQFLAIPDDSRTTTLVIGSGTWRWADLVTPPGACLAGTPDVCSPTRQNP